MSAPTVCVYTASGEFEAQQVRAFLETNGIPCELHGEALRKTHGLTLDGLGEVRVHVAAADEDQARELLRHAESGALRLGDSDEEDPPEGAVLPFPRRR